MCNVITYVHSLNLRGILAFVFVKKYDTLIVKCFVINFVKWIPPVLYVFLSSWCTFNYIERLPKSRVNCIGSHAVHMLEMFTQSTTSLSWFSIWFCYTPVNMDCFFFFKVPYTLIQIMEKINWTCATICIYIKGPKIVDKASPS